MCDGGPQTMSRPGASWRHAALFVLVLLGAGSLEAQGARIGYVDMKRLLDNAPQVLEARTRLAREFSERDQKLKADAEKLAAEIDALRRGTQRAREQLRDELARRSKEELDKRWPEIYGVVVEYAREQRYDLVVEAPVLYASPSVDITDAVLERLRHPAPAPGAPK